MHSLCALIISIVAGAVSQLAMKSGLQQMDSVTPHPLLIFGISCYGFAMLSWIIALKKYELSFAYPLLSAGYLLVYVGAFFCPGLQEELSLNKTIGLLLVMAGVTLSACNPQSDGQVHDEQRNTA